MIFETIQILVPLPAQVATVRFLLLHSDRARVRYGSKRVNDGECTVVVLLKLLALVTMLRSLISYNSLPQVTQRHYLTCLWYLRPFWFL